MATYTKTVYPYLPLTKLPTHEKPSKKAIKNLMYEIFENGCAVDDINGQEHGMAAEVMEDHGYLTLTDGAEWVPPINPGPMPALAGTANERQQQLLLFQEQQATWKHYISSRKDLKDQLIKAIPPQFISSLKSPTTGFASISPKDILEYLVENYGNITAKDLRDNLKTIKNEWVVDQPMETLFVQMQDAQDFAKERDPISDDVIIGASIELLEATGVFETDLRDWNQLNEGEQTWPHFKIHFNKAYDEYKNKVTTKAAGYSGKATASKNPTNSPARKTKSNQSQSALWPEMTFDKPFFYCYTHGLNRSHTGKNCNRKNESHKDEATVDNRMGGSLQIMAGFKEKTKAAPKSGKKE
jgi:hypothetical protein